MRDFWPFARMMLRYPWRFAGAIAAAIVGAAMLGLGLGGMLLVLQQILGKQGKNLPTLLADLNEKLDKSSLAHGLGLHVPDHWIATLPTGRYDAVLYIVVALAFVTLIGSLANFAHGYLSMTVAGRTLVDVRRLVYAHVVRLPLKTVVGEGPSTVVSHVVFDTWQIWGGFEVLMQKTIAQLFKGVAALIAALIISWQISIGAVVVGLFLALFIRTVGKRIRKASRRGLEAQAELQRTSQEAVGHLRVVKTSNAEEREETRFAAAANAYLRQDMKVRTAKSISNPLVEFIGLTVLGVISVVSAKAIIDGAISAEDFIATLVSLGTAAGVLKPLTTLYNNIQMTAAAAQRLRRLLDLPVEPGHDKSLPALPRHARDLELRNVTLTYPGASTPAIDRVSLTIPHGQTVAFVGPNGSGKTTLLSLIPRLFDPDTSAGSVLVDGVDIRSVNLDSLRAQIGVVTQETALFKGSLRWNLAYGVEHATDAQIRDAARRARAEDFILAKPGGYDFEVGESGSGLSGGQRQRLAIARAILRDPAILILDEATSMVDADSERQIADALAEFSRGRTCLIVAHRLSTVIHADRIVVMNHGRIEDVGRHDELLARCPTYRTIAEHQLIKAPLPEPVA